MNTPEIEIAGRRIGGGAAPYIVAEIGINHGGNLERAIRLISAAKGAGVDAAKFQAFITSEFLTRNSSYYDLLASCALGADDFRQLFAHAANLAFPIYSAVFDEMSADLLHELQAGAFKIASGDITHLPLLRHVAQFGKPTLVSTGGATLNDIRAACDAIREVNAKTPIGLFHCVSNYPTEPADANLACIAMMRETFQVPVGFSDHTLGSAAAVAAVALGADMIEKHFTLDKDAEGPDHALSLDPFAMSALVSDIRSASAAVGSAKKAPVEASSLIEQIRRSVTARSDIPRGTKITSEMLAIKRPGTGIAPSEMTLVVGRRAARNIDADSTITWKDLG